MQNSQFIYASSNVQKVFNDENLLRIILWFAGCKPSLNKSCINRCVGITNKGKRCKCKVNNNKLLCFTHNNIFYNNNYYDISVFYLSKQITNYNNSKNNLCNNYKKKERFKRLKPIKFNNKEYYITNNNTENFYITDNPLEYYLS